MRYYSLQGKAPKVSFKDAAILGQAPDGGLYFPEEIPGLSDDFFSQLKTLSAVEMGYEVMAPFVGESIPEEVLKQIISDTINFDIPVVPVDENIFSLELFHGPTLAFKDVGARFMSRCLGYFVQQDPAAFKQKITVLVATSGDTGGAVAHGFYGVEGVDVVILYPSGKVSKVQEWQLTTLGKNVTALEVTGTFDDCQRMVKQAFADTGLRQQRFLTSANSINISRWLSQQLYYFLAYQQWEGAEAPVISVPSGNFGNICAGILASVRGLPVSHFIAACNANDVVSGYLESGTLVVKQAVPTISNAMDVGDPSNFGRILRLFDNQYEHVKNRLSAYTISDKETKEVIKSVFHEKNYLLDPHGAVAYAALTKYLEQYPHARGIFLETAHPVKFYDVVEPVTGQEIEIPENLKSLQHKVKQSEVIAADYNALKEFLLSR